MCSPASCRRAGLGALVLGDKHQGGTRPRAPGIHELRRFRARSMSSARVLKLTKRASTASFLSSKQRRGPAAGGEHGQSGERIHAEASRSGDTNGRDGKDTHRDSVHRRPWQQGRAAFVSWQIRKQTRKGERLEKEGEGNREEKEETGGNSSVGFAGDGRRRGRW